MTQPVWITPAGSLGTRAEGEFFRLAVRATANDRDVFFRLIAGELPAGVQLTSSGVVEGAPKSIVEVQGVPREVGEDVTSRFAVRAYTTRQIGNQTVIDSLADRTFTITITGQDLPEFITPPGEIARFYDGTKAETRIEFTDPDPDDVMRLGVISGELPPGMVLNPRTGVISGVIIPLTGPPGTAQAGYDRTEFDEYAFDFTTQAESRNFEFTIGISDGKSTNLRSFSIYVYATDTLEADNTDITADDTFVTADATSRRSPLLLTPQGSLGTVRADNYFAFQFTAVDWDGDPFEFVANESSALGYDPLFIANSEGGRDPATNAFNFQPGSFDFDNEPFDQGVLSLPPGLELDPNTGWLYGYIPNQQLTEQTYQFGVRVRKISDGSSLEPGVSSPEYFFTLTVIGDVEVDTIWLTDPNLGIIDNGGVSTFGVRAQNIGEAALQYRMAPGFDNRLPQGLTLQSNGDITGRVSFNTFAVDGGATTFDVDINPRLGIDQTTFDLKFEFTVNAFATSSVTLGFKVISITVTDGGDGYSPLNPPAVTISTPPPTENAIPATVASVTIVGGKITAITVGNPGRGYTSAPTVTIGGSGGATATAQIEETAAEYAVSVFRRFTITVNRAFNEPYETLYIKAMPPTIDRDRIADLLDAKKPNALIPYSSLYRPTDPNFGIATSIIYDHAYGLSSAALETYVQAMDLNHYWKNITLGPIRTAQALDSTGNVLYEVVYSEIIDDLVNNQGVSVDKSVDLAYTIDVDGDPVSVVYPNSLINMRDQVIDTVGQVSPALPLWMTSKQPNKQVLGFTPAWVMAYVKPGESGKIAYNLQQNLGYDKPLEFELNSIDYEVDRYELDLSQTYNWDPNEPDVTIDIESILGNGTEVIVNFIPQINAPFLSGDRISIQNTTNIIFNGWFSIASCTSTQLRFEATTIGTSVGGKIISRATWIPHPPLSTTFDKNTQRLYSTPNLSTFGRIDSTSTQYAFGTDTLFTVTPTTPSPFVIVTLNGLIQEYANTSVSGISGDFWITYAFNSFTVQFVTAPPSTTTSYVSDGSSTDYSYSPIAGRGLVVQVDGVTQILGTDYSVLAQTVIFTDAPQEFAPISIIQPSTVDIYQIKDIYDNDSDSNYQTQTTWDQGSTTFNSPADRWIPTDEFDKYLVFPKRTIIG